MCTNPKLPQQLLGDVSLATWSATLDAVAGSAELIMLYFMGESTLHPDFETLIAEARERTDAKLVLSTNALDISDSQLRSIVDHIDLVLVCIDRWDPAAYERIRRGSDFEKVVANAERLLDARGNKPSPIVVVKTLDMAFPRETRQDLEVEAERFNEFWRGRGAVPLNGWLNTWAGQLLQISRMARHETPYSGTSTRPPCADLWFKMVVNWRGDVVLCCHNYDYSVRLGTVSEQGVDGVWNGARLQELRHRHLAGDFDVAICAGCREWGEVDELEAYLALNEQSFFKIF